MSDERIVRYSADEIREMIARGESKSDWQRIDAMTDEEIEASIRDDPDWAGEETDWSKATLVYPISKQALSIRVDRDVIDFFKAEGKGYQTRINAVLRRFMQEELKRRAG